MKQKKSQYLIKFIIVFIILLIVKLTFFNNVIEFNLFEFIISIILFTLASLILNIILDFIFGESDFTNFFSPPSTHNLNINKNSNETLYNLFNKKQYTTISSEVTYGNKVKITLDIPPITKYSSSPYKANNTNYKKIIDNEIKRYLPNFNRNLFVKDTFNTYLSIQELLKNSDYLNIKHFVSDNLYNIINSKLSSKNQYQNQTSTQNLEKDEIYSYFINSYNREDIYKNHKLGNSSIINFEVKDNNIYITNCMTVILYNSHLQILHSSSFDLNYILVTYEMTFLCPLSSKPNTFSTLQCPNCAAPLDSYSNTICKYCNSNLEYNDSKFILEDIKVVHYT